MEISIIISIVAGIVVIFYSIITTFNNFRYIRKVTLEIEKNQKLIDEIISDARRNNEEMEEYLRKLRGQLEKSN